MFSTFAELIEVTKKNKRGGRVAVVGSQSPHALEAVVKASQEGLVTPVLFGDAAKTKELLRGINVEESKFEIYDCDGPEQSVFGAIQAILSGKADFIMKGLVETATMMKVLLNRENNMRMEGGIVSSVTIAEIETYHKLIALTDGSIAMPVDAEQKKKILESTVAAMCNIGWECPKVAVLAAIENVNPKMPATVDAAALQQMYERGEIKDCIVAGPMAIDVALNRESAELKGITSEIAGDADLLLYPDITSGNIGIKTLITTGHNLTGSVILGLKAPVVMSSRGSTTENKLRSLMLASAMVKQAN